jgi:hypothetical protein
MKEPHDNPAVVKAAQWLAEQKEPPKLAVPALKEEFGLKASEACEAIRLAQNFRTVRRAFG